MRRILPSSLFACMLLAGFLQAQDSCVVRKQELRQRMAKEADGSLSASGKVSTDVFDFYVSNDGCLADDPENGGYGGLYLPAGQKARRLFYTGGLWLVGKVNGDIRTASCQYSTEYQPGMIQPDGTASDPHDPKWKMFSYSRVDTVEAEALAQGAPAQVLGDQMLYCVFNDMGSHENLNGTLPLGVEVRQTVWVVNYPPSLDHIAFLKYQIINKGTNTIDSAYIALFSDADIGDSNDDYCGCDPAYNMFYNYNGDGYDDDYGVAVPALGFSTLKGPYVPQPGAKTELPDGTVKWDTTMLEMTASFVFL